MFRTNEEKFELRKADWRAKWDSLQSNHGTNFHMTSNETARKVLILLEEYAGLTSIFPTGVTLFFKGHPNRRYVERVKQVVLKHRTKDDDRILSSRGVSYLGKVDVKSILAELKNAVGDQIVQHGDLNALLAVIKEETKVDFYGLDKKKTAPVIKNTPN